MSKYPPAKYSKLLDADTQLRLRIMNESAAAAVAENRARGIPEFFLRDGVMIYRYPDGRETTECPEVLKPKTPMSEERGAELRAKGLIK